LGRPCAIFVRQAKAIAEAVAAIAAEPATTGKK
jgi:hypothetical protein